MNKLIELNEIKILYIFFTFNKVYINYKITFIEYNAIEAAVAGVVKV